MTGLKQRLSRRSASGDASDRKLRLPDFLRGRQKAQRPPWGKRARQEPPTAPQQPPATGGEATGGEATGREAAGGEGAPGPATPVAKPASRWRVADLGGLLERLPLERFSRKRPTVAGAGEATPAEVVEAAGSSSFRDRGKLRRRLQYLRRARELAFRDVGGLMFDMRRFQRERPDLVEAKLAALSAVDGELRALERVLDDRRPIHELREPGLSSCQRCGALHASEDRFCPQCGMQFGGALAMGEVGGAIAAPPQAPAAASQAPPPPADPSLSPAAARPADEASVRDPADAQTEVNRPSDAS